MLLHLAKWLNQLGCLLMQCNIVLDGVYPSTRKCDTLPEPCSADIAQYAILIKSIQDQIRIAFRKK